MFQCPTYWDNSMAETCFSKWVQNDSCSQPVRFCFTLILMTKSAKLRPVTIRSIGIFIQLPINL